MTNRCGRLVSAIASIGIAMFCGSARAADPCLYEHIDPSAGPPAGWTATQPGWFELDHVNAAGKKQSVSIKYEYANGTLDLQTIAVSDFEIDDVVVPGHGPLDAKTYAVLFVMRKNGIARGSLKLFKLSEVINLGAVLAVAEAQEPRLGGAPRDPAQALLDGRAGRFLKNALELSGHAIGSARLERGERVAIKSLLEWKSIEGFHEKAEKLLAASKRTREDVVFAHFDVLLSMRDQAQPSADAVVSMVENTKRPPIQNQPNDDRPGVRFDISNIHVHNMQCRNVHIGFNVKHSNQWVQWIPGGNKVLASSNDFTIPNEWFFYRYDDLRKRGAIDQPFDGWFYVVATDTKTDLLEKGPTTFRVQDAPAAAAAPAGPAVYEYTNDARTVSIRLTDGISDNNGVFTGHGTFTFWGAKLDCQLIVARHSTWDSNNKPVYDYANNVKPGPECKPPYRFVGVEGLADFQAEDFYSYPNYVGYLYLTKATVSMNLGGTRAEASRAADNITVQNDGPSHLSFYLDSDFQFGAFRFAPGFLNVTQSGADLKTTSSAPIVNGKEATGLNTIHWTRQPDGFHFEYAAQSDWTPKLPGYGVK